MASNFHTATLKRSRFTTTALALEKKVKIAKDEIFGNEESEENEAQDKSKSIVKVFFKVHK